MVPIRALDPLGAIGIYWSEPHIADPADVEAVQAIADATAVTMERLRAERALVERLVELEEANDRLAEVNRRLEHVGSVIAHDLRSPLATVEGLLTTLTVRADHRPRSTEEHLTERATAQVHGLLDTVDALLTLSQVQTTPLVVRDVALSDLVAEVTDALAAEIDEAGAQIRLDADGTLRGDPVLLRLLLQNLVSNAVCYRDPERPQIVRIGLTRDGNEVELSVSDRGVGLDPQGIDQLFQLGYRGTRRGDGPGTGIGLVTCRHIVERHGGTITADPQRRGARLVVRLPEVA
jgi:signal transduction histidine kinase